LFALFFVSSEKKEKKKGENSLFFSFDLSSKMEKK